LAETNGLSPLQFRFESEMEYHQFSIFLLTLE
jgi:hypothetical protein